jgi:hypothetical protein
MGKLILYAISLIVPPTLIVLVLVWIDRARGTTAKTKRATWWIAVIVVAWITLDTLAVIIPAFRAGAAVP